MLLPLTIDTRVRNGQNTQYRALQGDYSGANALTITALDRAFLLTGRRATFALGRPIPCAVRVLSADALVLVLPLRPAPLVRTTHLQTVYTQRAANGAWVALILQLEGP